MINCADFKIWIMASRPKTLGAAIGPVLVGTAMAYGAGKGHALVALAALFCALMFQIGTNFANDYFDYLQGVDKSNRLGPVRVTQAGLVEPAKIRQAFILVFISTLPAGLYLISRGGWPILSIGVLSILSGIFYTAKPLQLGYRGWGDLFVLVFFGPVAVGGTYYIQTLEINAIVLQAGLALGLLATAILTTNNLRDIHSDCQAGKKTLAVRWGETFSRMEYLLAIGIAAFIPVIIFLQTRQHPYSLAASSVIIPALPAIQKIFQVNRQQSDYGPVLNHVLAYTGKLLLIFSLLFSIGWLI